LDKKPVTLREIALFGVLGAMTFGAKVAMSALPNIEPVSLFVMLFAVVFGRKCVYPIYLYVLLEILFYGLHLWSINYLYVWLILAIAAFLMKGVRQRFAWAMLCGVFGLLFGIFCAPVYLVSGGLSFAISWWISGIPFDISHCVGNFVIALILFVPLRELLEKLYRKLEP
jgi:energy-coupling factor transport system substrate-specific component